MATRKSRRQKAEEKKQQRIRMAIGIFIISIMVLSSVAFIVVFYSGGATQNGYDFQYEVRDDQLIVRTDQGGVPFYNFPDERFTLSRNATSTLQNADTLVLAVDPSDNESVEFAEFVRFDLSEYMDVSGAITGESNQLQFPVVSCDDATAQTPIAILDPNATGVSEQNNCFVFGARGVDIVYVRDALLYSYFDLL